LEGKDDAGRETHRRDDGTSKNSKKRGRGPGYHGTLFLELKGSLFSEIDTGAGAGGVSPKSAEWWIRSPHWYEMPLPI